MSKEIFMEGLNPKINSTVDFQNLNSGQAFVKGHLTPEKFVIEVSEVIPLRNVQPILDR